jgi:hypothetical protein
LLNGSSCGIVPDVMQKILIIIGVALVLAGLLWPWLLKLPLGRLPGDIVINKPHLKIFFPVTTMILVSIIISVILWFLRK